MWRVWNRILVVCFSLATVGTLVGVAFEFDHLTAQRSDLAVFAARAALAIAVFAVLAVYVWACDRCQDYLSQE